jgi:hypothetical protein
MKKLHNKMEVLLWRHSTSSQKRKGTSTIYLRITVNGIREDIGSTGIRIVHNTWCDQLQRIKGDDHLSSFKNEQLGMIEIRLWAIYNDLLRKAQGVTAERIKRLYVIPNAMSYLSAFELFQKEYNKNPKIADSSRKTLKNIKQLIVRYLIESNMMGVLLEEFNHAVMRGYREWCNNQNYKESYIVRSSRGIAQITEYAKDKKWITENPLDGYKIGREKIIKPKFVDSVQLAIWQKHKFLHPTAQRIADLFVLYARTGFHYQDLIQIIKNHKQYIITGIDGKQWIGKPRQKTEIEAKVPISRFPEIMQIVNKYGGWANVPTYSNGKMNDWLKICAAEINMKLVPAQQIYAQLSAKHGRTSFCDYCLNELGLSREALLTMMGRVSAAELDRYVRNDERGVVTAFRISDAALAS